MPTLEVRGINVYYEAQRTGEPLLCLPGALGTGRSDFGPQLAELSASYRVIAPEPRGYRQLHEGIPNARLHVFPEGKHNVHLRYAGEFNHLVRTFLADTAPAALTTTP